MKGRKGQSLHAAPLDILMNSRKRGETDSIPVSVPTAVVYGEWIWNELLIYSCFFILSIHSSLNKEHIESYIIRYTVVNILNDCSFDVLSV
jgi:hypothetical protein